MPSILPMFAAVVLLATATLPTRAAESYDNCKGFIDSLPASISTQGTWCLRKHLFTSMTSGVAITLANDNITIDCNHFRLSGYGAGAATNAQGVAAGASRQNATIRQCRIQGFKYGVALFGAGHLVEDNRFDGNTYVGILANGDHHVVRRNIIHDTGGSTVALGTAYGILTYLAVDVLDNTVSGVSPSTNQAGNGNAYGMYTEGNPNGSISGNRVRGLVGTGIGVVCGICNASNGRISLDRNHVVGSGGGHGMGCGGSSAAVKDNIISGFVVAISGCTDSGGNAVIP